MIDFFKKRFFKKGISIQTHSIALVQKVFFLALFWAVMPLCLLAQQKVIKGKVLNGQDGQPLSGVTISAGNAVNSITDQDGDFSITVAANVRELRFSYVGMADVVESIRGRDVITITMLPANSDLGEVVVVGYGTKRKETLTGAVSNITNKEIQTSTNVGLAQKLQGKVAGLQIRQLGGEPGTFDNMINIRGFGSPLYVIDGIIRDNAGDFQRMNPEDIESISVLKDASAAIYGFNSANGVIIVTTKKGSKGKASFNYNGVYGIMKPTDVPRMASAAEWIQMRNEAQLFSTGTPFLSQEEIQKYIDGAPGYESTDWYDVTMKNTANQQQHNLSASGGNEKTQYYMSLGYIDEKSFLRSNDMGYKRYTMRLNLTTELVKNLKVEVLIGGRYDNRYTPGENFFNIFKGTRVTLPTEKPYINDDPRYPTVVTPSNQNPLILSDKDITGYSETVNRNLVSSFALTLNIPYVEGLSLRGVASYDINNYQGKDVSKPYTLYSFANGDYIPSLQRAGTSSGISQGFDNYNQLTYQTQINYGNSFAGKHNVSALVAFEQKKEWGRNANLRRSYDGFYTIDQIDRASLNVLGISTGGNEYQRAYQSLLGRFNYDFDKKYLVELAFRYMGTYAYPPQARWGFFPIVSAGWRISEENFIRNNLSFISNLKLKGSFGEVGQEAGGPFQWIVGFPLSGGGSYEFSNGTLTTGAQAPGLVNPALTWVTATHSDIGLEIGLWNKLNVEIDVYRRDRTGWPAKRNLSLPNTFGTTLPDENLNSDRTQGIEFTLNHNNRIGKFSYGISGNFNYARTMNRYQERGPYTNSYNRWKNGSDYRFNDIVWGYTYVGQFQSFEEIANYPLQNGDQANIRELPGDFKYADINNDGVVDGNDMLPIFTGAVGNNSDLNAGGRKNPRINYGFTLNAAYEGFDLNVLFQGAAMYTVRFNEVYAEVMAFRGNTPAYFYDRWHLSDPYDSKSEWIPGKWPASRFIADVGSMYKESSIWRKDASYLRLKSIELGYTISPRLYKAAGIQKIRVYANGFNLLTFADEFVKPFDPERLEGLFNAGFNYPLTKNYNFGLNVTF
ncbi:MAG: TonB-dependent receptor [Chitinophagaceae bacterium]|nr:TonB-dependent receptor [Chitinophagaceae bacterium]